MALQSSGQISFADVILEHRPNNTTIGSGLKPFKLTDYNAYSTSSSLPLTLKEFYNTFSSYNTSRFDAAFGYNDPSSVNWSASLFDIREYKLFTNNFSPDPGSQTTLQITFTNGGTYKVRWRVESNNSTASFSIGYGSNFIFPTTISPDGFFGPFTNSTLNLSASSTSDSLSQMYVRIIRIA